MKKWSLLLTLILLLSCSKSDPNRVIESLNIQSPRLVKVPGGSFSMGSDHNTPSEKPAHAVTISEFWMSSTEITVGQFAEFVTATGYLTTAEKDSGGWIFDTTISNMAFKKDATWKHPYMDQNSNHPAVLVTWFDAQAYCEWLSRTTGLAVSLPTEAQWEYACKAGSADNVEIKDIAWIQDSTQLFTHETASKKSNAFGIYDMLGNVWEWTSDWYSDYTASTVTNPRQSTDLGRGKIVRGGSWNFPAEFASPTFRQPGHGPKARAQDLGFRIVVQMNP
ncbi:formylglycine-generating enzyme family protein [bacterium]|nr:formylglycine-generating enzyme family protein [bacterium]